MITPLKNFGELRFLAAGASVRALLEMVTADRRSCGAIDLFCDRDTQRQSGQSRRVGNLTEIGPLLRSIDSTGPPVGVVWSGGIENHPELANDLHANPHLKSLGCSGTAMRAARDPWNLFDTLRSAGFRCLVLDSADSPIDRSRRWVVKPVKSAGGARIFHPDQFPTNQDPANFYRQEFVPGVVYGASLVAGHRKSILAGVCRHGRSSSVSEPFRYEGSAGPVPMPSAVQTQLQAIGDCVTKSFQLCGWFGIDFAVRGTDVCVLEINPRFTASMELLKDRTGHCLWQAHLEACGFAEYAEELSTNHPSALCQFAGKQFLFNDSPAELEIDEQASDQLWERSQFFGGDIRDVPAPGARIQSGEPICTMWAESDSLDAVSRRLAHTKKAVTALLQ